MERKIETPKQYYFYEGRTTLKDIVNFADAQIPDLLEAIQKEQLSVTGPMEFIYFGASGNLENEFTLQIALPVVEQKKVSAPYKIRQAAAFDCTTYTLKGSLEALAVTYDQVFAEIYQNNLQPSGEIREVYHVYTDYTSAENVTEIQIGIK